MCIRDRFMSARRSVAATAAAVARVSKVLRWRFALVALRRRIRSRGKADIQEWHPRRQGSPRREAWDRDRTLVVVSHVLLQDRIHALPAQLRLATDHSRDHLIEHRHAHFGPCGKVPEVVVRFPAPEQSKYCQGQMGVVERVVSGRSNSVEGGRCGTAGYGNLINLF